MNAASQSTHNPSYVLLTAAYNEEHYIEETIWPVVTQVLRPQMWVIVSDASPDWTDEIGPQDAMTLPSIRLARRERERSREFASKVSALRAGFKMLARAPIRFIAPIRGA